MQNAIIRISKAIIFTRFTICVNIAKNTPPHLNNINIIVFEEKENKTSIKKNILDIELSKNDIYILIYEKNKIYEHLILYKNFENKSSVLFQDNNEKIEKKR